MLAYHLALFREGQNEVNEQGGLQDARSDVYPINHPVEIIQLAGVFKRIGDERNQTEDVEMGRTGGGPASQQNIEPNSKIDKSDDPQPVVKGAFPGLENDTGIERHRLPQERISRFGPNAITVKLALQRRQVVDFLTVDGN